MSEEKKDNNFDDMIEKAKDFAQDIAQKAGEFAAAIGDKTEEYVEIAKKKIESEKLEYAINKKYRELGKAYYAQVKLGGDASVDELLEELEALHVALEAADIDEDDVDAAEEADCCAEEAEDCGCAKEEPTDCGCDKKEE